MYNKKASLETGIFTNINIVTAGPYSSKVWLNTLLSWLFFRKTNLSHTLFLLNIGV